MSIKRQSSFRSIIAFSPKSFLCQNQKWTTIVLQKSHGVGFHYVAKILIAPKLSPLKATNGLNRHRRDTHTNNKYRDMHTTRPTLTHTSPDTIIGTQAHALKLLKCTSKNIYINTHSDMHAHTHTQLHNLAQPCTTLHNLAQPCTTANT